ncbi:MAG: hypothetical protein QE273_17175, partial [Verrucomicrobiales bacterium]|nr:hypothetical protein [Verrucomicrobiales bacterium]
MLRVVGEAQGLADFGEDFKPAKAVQSAGVMAAADNSFTLYLNAQQVLAGGDWSKLESTPVTIKSEGVNRLLLVAENGLKEPNAAGAFAALRIVYTDGTDEVIATDETWTVSNKMPSGNKPAEWKIPELTWEKVVPVSLPVWSNAVDPQVGTTLASCSVTSPLMVRAGLVKSDFLMRSLGRPNRDQIV